MTEPVKVVEVKQHSHAPCFCINALVHQLLCISSHKISFSGDNMCSGSTDHNMAPCCLNAHLFDLIKYRVGRHSFSFKTDACLKSSLPKDPCTCHCCVTIGADNVQNLSVCCSYHAPIQSKHFWVCCISWICLPLCEGKCRAFTCGRWSCLLALPTHSNDLHLAPHSDVGIKTYARQVMSNAQSTDDCKLATPAAACRST